jgi:diguanylate cyclase (GGDEF)-like protein
MALIVIVDDSVANGKIYARLAANVEPGIAVRVFSDPHEALGWLAGNPAELIITDYKMPAMDGAEFTRALRALPTCIDVPVIVVTAYADQGFRIEALQAGASDFLQTPIDHVEFLVRTRNLLGLGCHQRRIRERASTLERELKRSEDSRDQLLRDSREQLAQVIDTVPAMISATDPEGRCIFANAYRASMLGQEIRPESEPGEVGLLDQAVLASGNPLDPYEEQIAVSSGEIRTFVTTKLPLHAATGKVVGVLTTSIDISDQKETEARLLFEARHDHLTSLPNRAHLYHQLRTALVRARANGQTMALLFIDLDRFKSINDGLGHHVGDCLLRAVADRLRSTVRAEDIVARLGGDEFAILQPTVGSRADAEQLARRLNQVLLEPFLIDGREVTTSASIGLTVFPGDGDTPEEMLQNADLAMYRVKSGGRNGFEFFAHAMLSQARDDIRLQVLLRRALEKDEFVLHYQPQIALRSGRVIGVEALIRWQHENQTLTWPADFLRVADEAGLMASIDQWVLREACRQAQRWAGRLAEPIRVSVNVAALRFPSSRFYAQVMDVLAETQLPPTLLELELTEGILLPQTRSATWDLEQLHRNGVRLSVDDFGTGFSSLARLTSLHVDLLKIDRSFVSNIQDPHNAAIIRAVASLGRALGIEVLAEGVETPFQLEQVRLAGCDFVQGFYTARPMSAARFEEFLERGPVWSPDGVPGQAQVAPMASLAGSP